MEIGIYNWAEIAASLTCLFCWAYKPSALNGWFVGFLLLTVLIEFTGKVTTPLKGFKTPMYNFFNIVEFIFYLLVLRQFTDTKMIRRFLLLLIVPVFLFFIINIFFIQKIQDYNSYTSAVGSFILLAACLVLLLEVLSSDNKLYIIRWPGFWIISPLILFYAGNFFNVSLMNYTFKYHRSEATMLYKLFNRNLNVVLYSCFAIAFILDIKYQQKDSKPLTGIKNDQTL